ncbi:Ca(2+)-dependent cysteine protease [Ceratobasidium sp. 395]|nr:Ca(2+)-dependent cysteine protease [Ceratobasidium sp. 395]
MLSNSLINACNDGKISISYGIRKPPPKLTGTYTDAYNIINLLTNQFGYLENEICVLADLIDKSGEKDELRWPSRTNIIRALKWLNSGSKEGNQRFLFFAGHGYRRVENKSGYTYEGKGSVTHIRDLRLKMVRDIT